MPWTQQDTAFRKIMSYLYIPLSLDLPWYLHYQPDEPSWRQQSKCVSTSSLRALHCFLCIKPLHLSYGIFVPQCPQAVSSPAPTKDLLYLFLFYGCLTYFKDLAFYNLQCDLLQSFTILPTVGFLLHYLNVPWCNLNELHVALYSPNHSAKALYTNSILPLQFSF